MANNEYYREIISEVLCDLGKFELFTSKEIEVLAEAVATSAEMEGEYTGSRNIPNPAVVELNNLQREVAREKERRELEFQAQLEEANKLADRWYYRAVGLKNELDDCSCD